VHWNMIAWGWIAPLVSAVGGPHDRAVKTVDDSCVNDTNVFPKPVAPSPSTYSETDTAPAMQPANPPRKGLGGTSSMLARVWIDGDHAWCVLNS
jgi:hypothetical protein